MSREEKNKEKAKYCKGCAWLHIGQKVEHNHCDYTGDHDQSKLEKRVNGHTNYTSAGCKEGFFKLEEYLTPSVCRWFWDKKLEPNPSKSGFLYKAPNSNACPKIPIINLINK